jgi:hypothetical protein
LFDRLQNNLSPWIDIYTSIVKQIKVHVKTLPCLGIPSDNAFKIVETDASEIGFGGILKQLVSSGSPEQIVQFHSGSWNSAQSNYSTIKKEIIFVVLCITKFQYDLLNQRFLLRIDCKSAKYILKKDVENIASKQIFARWQTILSAFDFDIEYIKGFDNSIPNFLTREFLIRRRLIILCIWSQNQSLLPLSLLLMSLPFTFLLFTSASLLSSTYFLLKRIILILNPPVN